MNTLLHALYDDPQLAEQTIAQLTAAGIARSMIQSINMSKSDHVGGFGDSGAHMHDAARDHVGGFGDSGAHMHDAARDRAGSFSDSSTGGDTIADLVRAGLSQAEAQAAAARLGVGATLILVRAEGAPAAQAAAILQQA